MKVGDVLEWIAGGCAIAAAFLYLSWPLALLAIALFLGYEAQCLSTTEIRIPRPHLDVKRRWRRARRRWASR
jgi:hypothetical protein